MKCAFRQECSRLLLVGCNVAEDVYSRIFLFVSLPHLLFTWATQKGVEQGIHRGKQPTPLVRPTDTDFSAGGAPARIAPW